MCNEKSVYLIFIPKYHHIIPKNRPKISFRMTWKRLFSLFTCMLSLFYSKMYENNSSHIVFLGNFSNISFNNTNSEYFCEQTVVTIAFASLLIQWLMLPFGVLIVCLDMKYEPIGQIRNHSLQSRLQSTVNRRPNTRWCKLGVWNNHMGTSI